MAAETTGTFPNSPSPIQHEIHHPTVCGDDSGGPFGDLRPGQSGSGSIERREAQRSNDYQNPFGEGSVVRLVARGHGRPHWCVPGRGRCEGICKDLLDGKAIEIQAKKGEGPEVAFVGTRYHLEHFST